MAYQVTPSIVKQELESMSATARSIEGLEISASTVARQVSATYLHDDCNLEVEITLAESHPLRVVEVKLTSHLGVCVICGYRYCPAELNYVDL